ncbi:NADH dehydrogenase [Cladophialophora psammophila CBS 110553]|uniref:NADH dehydrogenase [ubiquinone] 1 alpha subcomplex subunit 13 n=1 Tax=Cladophialophora psammophila CBS 110553 TaxID=1182543 RepID=W9WZ58_9EURO|nr:NADH dehydrogenase [Cladophialophora psammophila CBS 110553]EXJ73497.1 NADH dehydrogenase [Cladophialophora psammophila CBS 110553]
MPQDLPPTGGYEAVQYRRNIPTRGLKPFWYLVGVGLVMAYGWRQVFVGQREKHEMAREKMWSRIHLTPLLQAEEDRDQVRRYYADLAREKELLGSQSGAYNSDRYAFLFPFFCIVIVLVLDSAGLDRIG